MSIEPVLRNDAFDGRQFTPGRVEKPRAEQSAEIRRAGKGLLALGLFLALPTWISWMRDLVVVLSMTTPDPLIWWRVVKDWTDPEVCWIAWPILMGMLCIWKPWKELRGALWISGIALLLHDLTHMVLYQKFGIVAKPVWLLRVPRAGQFAGLVLGARLLAEVAWLWTSRGALRRELRRPGMPKQSGSRPAAVVGRMSALAGLVFTFVAVFASSWVVFEQVGLQSPWLRNQLGQPYFVQGRRPQLSSGDRRVYQAVNALESGLRYAGQGSYRNARDAFVKGLSELQEIMSKNPAAADSVLEARVNGLNNLAWLLATCPELELRDHEKAVVFARQAVELRETEGHIWNTLGVAQFRAGALDDARRSLERAMALRNGGDAYDWFFLCMIEASQGSLAEARTWYEKAVEARMSGNRRNRELYRFQREAAELLGVPPPGPPENIDL